MSSLRALLRQADALINPIAATDVLYTKQNIDYSWRVHANSH